MNTTEGGIRACREKAPTLEDLAVMVEEVLEGCHSDISSETQTRTVSDPQTRKTEDVLEVTYHQGMVVDYVHDTLYGIGYTYTIPNGVGEGVTVTYFHEDATYDDHSGVPL